MSTTYEKLSSNQAKLSFTVSAEDFEKAINADDLGEKIGNY